MKVGDPRDQGERERSDILAHRKRRQGAFSARTRENLRLFRDMCGNWRVEGTQMSALEIGLGCKGFHERGRGLIIYELQVIHFTKVVEGSKTPVVPGRT
jgi:hypothetical protein